MLFFQSMEFFLQMKNIIFFFLKTQILKPLKGIFLKTEKILR